MSQGPPARQAILDAARLQLERRSPNEISMEGVAMQAGFSRQAVYRHFGSRAGLLSALLADIDEVEGARSSVEQVLAAGTGAECVERLFAWWVDYVPRFVGIARGVLAAKREDADLRAAWDDRMRALHAVCQAVVERCDADRTLAAGQPPGEASEMLWALLSVPLWIQLREDAGWTEEQYRRRMAAMALAALKTSP